jgi:hypothetical protein
MASSFSAAPSALGYLFQVRLALLLLLDADPDGEMSIELVDDVAFERDGEPAELLQLKHHLQRSGSLSNSSTDLWKTLRVWSNALKQKTISLPPGMLTLITTEMASPDSAAFYLRTDPARNPDNALQQLQTVCTTSSNKDNEKAYAEFQLLTLQQKRDLVNSIHVLDNAPNILDVSDRIRRELRFSTHPSRLDSLVQRVEGWWFDRVVRHLAGAQHGTIRFAELRSQIADIAEKLKPDALPVDFQSLTLGARGSAMDDRRFVKQLRLITVADRRVEDAKRDYYRAYEQRSKWVREDLISVTELQNFESRLTEEWQRRFYDASDSLVGDEDERQLQECGLRIYRWMELEANYPIRPHCLDLFLTRGSYHMLADEPAPRVGWHPHFVARLAVSTDSSANGSAS